MADVNGDGRPDLLGFQLIQRERPHIWRAVACFQNGSDNVSDFVQMPVEWDFYSVLYSHEYPVFVDWDGDGDVDFLRISMDDLSLIHI